MNKTHNFLPLLAVGGPRVEDVVLLDLVPVNRGGLPPDADITLGGELGLHMARGTRNIV